MTTVALVAARDAAASIAATVRSLRLLGGVDEVWVVDDGSSDTTADRAADAGARVVRLERNRGKGGALAVGVAATPHADRYLLADADLGDSASGLQPLLDAAPGGLVVGVLPSARGRGGFGAVTRLAAAGIRRACGVDSAAPLSGQRVVDGLALRDLVLAPRFGVEVGMTIDLARAGVAVREVDVDVEHHHRGRGFAGFAHRGNQGLDIASALVSRLTTPRQRIIAILATGVAVFFALTALSYVHRPPTGTGLPRSNKVVLFAYDGLRLRDVDRVTTRVHGAVGALSVRTSDRRSFSRRAGSERPSLADAFATLGASARVRAARDMVASRALARSDNADSLPGALGDALRAAGKRTAVISDSADTSAVFAIADRHGRVGRVSAPPFATALRSALERADVVLVASDARSGADDWLRQTLAVRDDATLVVFSPTPPGKDWELTPIVVAGNGIRSGSVESATTRRPALAGLVDIAPTVLHTLGVEAPAPMTGASLRTSDDSPDLAAYQRLQIDGAVRSRFFLPAAVGYTVAALAFYLLFLAIRQRRVLRVGVCIAAAFPFALLVTGAAQHWLHFGGESPLFLIAVTAALGGAASRVKGVGPVYVLAALCVVVISLDVAATGPLHAASLLGYTIQTTGRYYGLPNASFSIYASSVLLLGAAVAGWEPTRVGATAATVVLTVGTAFLAAPWLGNDVGGFLTMLPVSAATAWALLGGRFTRRTVTIGAGALVALFVAVAAIEARTGSSHLSRAAAESATNRSGLRSTLTRRINANFGLLVDQWWGFGSLALSGVGIALLARGKRFADYLPPRSGLRVCAIAVLVTSILGFLVNDSGPVVNVLCVVVLAPAAALTALAGSLRVHRPAGSP